MYKSRSVAVCVELNCVCLTGLAQSSFDNSTHSVLAAIVIEKKKLISVAYSLVL